MPARPRGSARGGSRRISSTVRKLDKRGKGKTPPRPRILSRIRSSPLRRSRSPRPARKAPTRRSPVKRRFSLSPKRTIPRTNREDLRLSPRPNRDGLRVSPRPKRDGLRGSPRPSRDGLRLSPRPSRDDLRLSPRPARENSRVSPRRSRDSSKNRKLTPEKKYIDKPPYHDPVKDHQRPPYTNEDLKNLVFRVPRNCPEKLGEQPKANIVDPENVVVVRRPVTDRGRRDFADMENFRISRFAQVSDWSYRRDSDRGHQGEGSTPIFHRPEIYENERKYNDYDPGPSHSDRLPCDTYRIPQYYPEDKDRSIARRSLRDYDFNPPREERQREEGRYQPSTSSRRSPSFDRSRDYPPERRDRYDERDGYRGPRRSLDRDRGRSDDRLTRRHHSPSPRRRVDERRDYEDRRARSLERRDVGQSHFRDEYSSRERFSSADRNSKSRGYFEDGRENPLPAAPPRDRERDGGFYPRARGAMVPARPYGRIPGVGLRHIPPGRPIRGVLIPRGPVRRLPFAPRKSFRGSLQGRR